MWFPFRNVVLLATLPLVVSCSDRRSLEELQRVLGTVQDEAPTLPDDPLHARYEEVERLFARGLTPVDLPERVSMRPGSPLQRSMRLRGDTCHVVAAVAEPDRVDLQLIVADADGEELAADRSRDAFPVVPSFCPPADGLYSIRLQVRGGEAEVLWNVWPVREDAALVGGLLALRDRWAPAGRATGPMHRGLLAEGGRLDVPVALLPGTCYAVVARAQDEGVDLDLALLDARKQPLLRDIALDATPVLPRYCPEQAELLHLRFTMFSGRGPFHWQVFEWPAQADATQGNPGARP